MIDKVDGLRIGGEYNKYIAEMWIALEKGWIPENNYSKDDYIKVKNNKDLQPHLTGWIGINCSYSGKWFGGYAGEVITKQGVRNYQLEAWKNTMTQVDKIKGVNFFHNSYDELEIPSNSIILCDPPYEGTTGYKDAFDNAKFWDWCRQLSNQGHSVFICEYNAPDDFECIWQKELKSSLSANGKIGGNKLSTERLLKFRKQELRSKE